MADTKKRFTKIDADGKSLPQVADAWELVLDNTTGLMWPVAEQEVDNYEAAIAAVAAMTAGGHTDWRFPTVDELFALADRTRSDPAIDTDYFPDCESSWYWSSTPYAPSPGGCAWGVSFGSGGAGWSGRNDGGFVRAVRGGQ